MEIPTTASGEAASVGVVHKRRLETVFILHSDRMGEGDDSLGERLVANFLHTLSTMEDAPFAIVLYNGAVRLLRSDVPWSEALRQLQAAGVELLACVTCLEHFDLLESMAVGRVSNMREIVRTMLAADRVITI